MGTDSGENASVTEATTSAVDELQWKVPPWAGKPPDGIHLDVVKGEKLVQKLMIDEKRCYYFGRNPQQCDFAIDHASCSRVHAALVYHKHLQRFFLVDLGSSHGTYIGKISLEALTPQHLSFDLPFHFGASTRRYVLKERLNQQKRGPPGGDVGGDSGVQDEAKGVEGLPQKEEELQSLTEYNTALNGRLGTLPIPDEPSRPQRRKANARVIFAEADDIINPEDVDPSVGRFRNLISTAVISKKPRMDDAYNELMSGLGFKGVAPSATQQQMQQQQHHHSILHQTNANPGAQAPYFGRGPTSKTSVEHVTGFGPISTKLGLSMPNLAPDVDLAGVAAAPAVAPIATVVQPMSSPDAGLRSPRPLDEQHEHYVDDEEVARKKKYAKEAWPGKKPGHVGGLLMA